MHVIGSINSYRLRKFCIRYNQMGDNLFTKRNKMSSSKKRRLQLLEEDNPLADCEFLVGDPESKEPHLFRCHKMTLATASEGFERMFYGNFVVVGPVKVTEVSPSSFKYFLRYVYIYETDLEPFPTIKELGELFYLADKYMMQDLTDAIVEHLKRTHKWTLGDVWPMYDLACLHENLPLLSLCYKEISKYGEKLFTVDSFYKLNVNHLKRLAIFLSQQIHVSTKLILQMLEEYGRRNKLYENWGSVEFQKLVDAVWLLDLKQLSTDDFKKLLTESNLFINKEGNTI